MATTIEPYSGDGSDTTFAFNHPSYQESDIKVTVDGNPYTNTGVTGGSPGATTFTIPNYTTSSAGNIVFNTAPGNLAVIRIFRDTNVDVAKATFQAGSSVKASDLNNTVKQLLYAAQEEQDQLEQTADIQDSAITSAKIADGTIVNADINASADISVSKLDHGTARQVLQTNSSGNGVEFTSSVDLPGTFQVRGNAFLDAATNVSGDLTVFNSGTQKFKVTKNDGNTDIEGTLDVAGTATFAGNIAVSGTVDGRDVAADGTKLDGIDANAKDDQTSTEIKTLLASDNLTDAHLAQNSVGTSEIKDDAVGADQLANTSVTAGSYGGSTAIPTVTVDAQGRITAASENNVDFDVVADTSPQLGGDLDVQAREITTSGTNQDITLTPTGSGTVTVKGTGSASGTVEVNTETNAKSIKIKAPTNSNLTGNYTLTLPVNDGDNGQFLKTDGAGTLSWDTVSGGGGGGGTAAPNSAVALTESANGSRTDFTMNTTPTSAFNLVVSVNGVVQKPNAGTTIAGSAEGFCISGSTLKFATAPANGSSIFVTLFSATVASDRITEGNSNVDIFDDNSTSRAVVNLDGNEKFRINEDGQIGLGGANYGTDGQVLTSQGPGAAAQWETIPTQNPNALDNIVEDTSPQLGGNLDVQSNKITTSTTNGYITLEPNGTGPVMIRGAGGNDAKVQLNCSVNSHGVTITSPPHSAGASYTLNLPDSLAVQSPVGGVRALGLVTVPGNTSTGTGELGFGTVDSVLISSISTSSDFPILFTHGTNTVASSSTTGSITITPNASINLAETVKLQCGEQDDLRIWHQGNSNILGSSGVMYLHNTGTDATDIDIRAERNILLKPQAGELGLQLVGNGESLLYYDGSPKLETYADGVSISSKILVGTGINGADGADEITVANTSGECGITIRSGSSSAGNLFFSDATSGSAEYAGYIQYDHVNEKLYFGANSALGMTLDSSQRVGIGTTNPGAWHDAADKLVIYEANQNTGMTISSNGTYSCSIFFADSDSGTGEYAGYIQYSHGQDELRLGASANDRVQIRQNEVEIVDGDLVIGTSGHGIQFDVNGSGSDQLLDDYEEGTWTPGLAFGANSSATGMTYGSRTGVYTKIGNLVYIKAHFHINNLGSSSGHARITGLPYTSTGSPDAFSPIADRGTVNLGNVSSGAVGMAMYLAGNSAPYLYGYKFNGAGNFGVTQSAFGTNSEIDINFVYKTS